MQTQATQTQNEQTQTVQMQNMQTQNKQTVENDKVAGNAMTYGETHVNRLRYLDRLSAYELWVYEMFWEQQYFPDEIASRMNRSIDEIVQNIVEIAQKLAPLDELV